jgi:gliding motility-associated-like protein
MALSIAEEKVKMKAFILSILFAAINGLMLISSFSTGSQIGSFKHYIEGDFSTNEGSSLLSDISKKEESRVSTEDRWYRTEKKSAGEIADVISIHRPTTASETETLEKTDTCKIAVVLETMINVAYDSIYYQWYFEGIKIPETVPSIEVYQSGAYAVDIFTRLNGDTQVTQQTFVVEVEELRIEEVAITNTSCNESNGALAVKVNRDIGIRYSINGGSFQEENFFGNLTAGTYMVAIQDSLNCGDSQEVIVKSSTPLAIEVIESSPATCGAANGRIVYEVSGGTGQIFALINTDTIQVSQSFDDLAKGEYMLTFMDETGCTLASKMRVSEAKCPIYIPNVFSPNDDGINDFFQIVAETNLNPTVNRYIIFDRWGGQLYEANNFFLNASDQWWDGTFNSKTVGIGTYLYLIEVEFEKGGKQVFQGELSVLK